MIRCQHDHTRGPFQQERRITAQGFVPAEPLVHRTGETARKPNAADVAALAAALASGWITVPAT